MQSTELTIMKKAYVEYKRGGVIVMNVPQRLIAAAMAITAVVAGGSVLNQHWKAEACANKLSQADTQAWLRERFQGKFSSAFETVATNYNPLPLFIDTMTDCKISKSTFDRSLRL